MTPIELVKLTPLMEATSGRSEVMIGLIDGPVVTDHPDLASENIRVIPGGSRGVCVHAGSPACTHGTLVAGVLSARRNSSTPAICPQCTLLLRPIFAETTPGIYEMPSATPDELARAIIETVDAGARVINLSAAVLQPSGVAQRRLQESLDYAARRGTIVVAAAGNQGTVGSTLITQHPWVIPVVACDLQGMPLDSSNLGKSIGQRGLRAPGDSIPSLGTDGSPRTFSGTSAAAPFVTGTVALLWSEFPEATAAEVKRSVTGRQASSRRTVVPQLLDAGSAHQFMSAQRGRWSDGQGQGAARHDQFA